MFLGLISALIFIIEAVIIIYWFRQIKEKSTHIPDKKIPMIVKPGRIEFTLNNHTYAYFWSEYKEAVFVKEALFLIPFNKKTGVLRFSKSDIDDQNFKLIFSEIKQKMKIKKQSQTL